MHALCMRAVCTKAAPSVHPPYPSQPNQGLLKPSQIDAALRRPLQEREKALQVLMARGLQLRQEQRKVG